MQQSNIFHNNFAGVIQPLVKKLEGSIPPRGFLSGREVVMKREGVGAIIAIDGEKNLHLLLSPALQDKDRRLSFPGLKGLKIGINRWKVAGFSAQNYLDISCFTGQLPLFTRPFIKLCEDILFDLSESQVQPSDVVFKTVNRWKRFWSPDTRNGFTTEWLHGLFGELLFLKELIAHFGPGVIQKWDGPQGSDHDFRTGNTLAVEVKTSVDIPFKINCNIRQLDTELFELLYIACYHLNPSENGTALPELIESIEEMIKGDEFMLDKFYEKLVLSGYERQSESIYSQFRNKHSKASLFKVDDKFPKITEGSFIKPPDHRISNMRYTLQLTGLKELSFKNVIKELSRFTANEK